MKGFCQLKKRFELTLSVNMNLKKMENTIEQAGKHIYPIRSVGYEFYKEKNYNNANLHNIFIDEDSSIFFEKLFLRIENLLFLGPAVLACIFIFFREDNYCKVYLFDHYFIVSHFDAGLFWCSCLSPLFLLHYTLRKTKRRNAVIAWIHIIVTLGIVFTLPYVYYQTPFLVEDLRMEFSPTPLYEIWHQKINLANNLWKLLITVQAIFIVYAFFELTFQRVSGKFVE